MALLLYAVILQGVIPDLSGHLLIVSMMKVPAAIFMAKVLDILAPATPTRWMRLRGVPRGGGITVKCYHDVDRLCGLGAFGEFGH
jgi:hypothetical protein